MTAYVALLRGINVGGRNLIPMATLADCFRDVGYANVRTYIQSGNVLFTSLRQDSLGLESDIERMLTKRLDASLTVIVRSREELEAVIAAAPDGHGSAELRSDALFLKAPLTAADVLGQMPELREAVDAVAPGPGVVYFSRVKAEATKTRFQRFMAMPVFKQITMRNWRTVTKLATMLAELDRA